MRLNVQYFAAFREAAGTASEELETAAATPDELFAECAGRHPGLRRYTASLVAVNDEMSDWNRALADGDRVLFFPPVAGG
jgi:molybdopterin converting factor small subunit